MQPARTLASSLLAVLGLGSSLRLPSGLAQTGTWQPPVKVHTNPKRNAERKRCKAIGHRQHRRGMRVAYMLRDLQAANPT